MCLNLERERPGDAVTYLGAAHATYIVNYVPPSSTWISYCLLMYLYLDLPEARNKCMALAVWSNTRDVKIGHSYIQA